MRESVWAFMLATVAVLGCGDDGGQRRFEDAALPDDAPVPSDAGSDAAVDAALPASANEITSAATTVQGGRFKADVQIGHPIGQQPATGNGTRIEGNSAVKP